MVQILQVIHALRDRKAPFDQLVDNDVRIRLTKVFNKGIECILNTQIVVNGKLQSGVNKMSIFRRGTRIIIINCNVWTYGNDVPSLWIPERMACITIPTFSYAVREWISFVPAVGVIFTFL